MGTLYNQGVALSWESAPLTASEADSLNTATAVVCAVGWATWLDDTGGYEVNFSQCLNPGRAGGDLYTWIPNGENNRECKRVRNMVYDCPPTQ